MKVGATRARASYFVALRLHQDAVASRDIATQCFAFLTRVLRAENVRFSGDDIAGIFNGRTAVFEALNPKQACLAGEFISRIPGLMAASFSIGADE